MGKRGPQGLSPVCDSLKELLEHKCPVKHYPFYVKVVTKECYCFAKTRVDAMRKCVYKFATVLPCSVQSIIEASNPNKVTEEIS